MFWFISTHADLKQVSYKNAASESTLKSFIDPSVPLRIWGKKKPTEKQTKN